MSSPSLFDLELLVAPISSDSPAGVDLRADTSPSSLYYRIKGARSQARAAERQQEMGDDSNIPDWKPILQTVPEVLAGTTKDFELAAYLLESLVRLRGFAGMRDGCRLIERLARDFGDVVYPLPDEDGLETRIAPLVGLNGAEGAGTLIQPLKNVPLTASTSVGEFGLAQYNQAIELEKADPSARERRISQGAVTLATIQSAVDESSAESLGNIRDDLREAIAAFQQMTATLDEKYGRDSPPSSSIRQTLSEALETLEKLGKSKLATLTPEAVDEPTAEADSGQPAPAKSAAPADSVAGIRNREDAFRILLQVADYFQKAEPHTPISYGLRQVVRWGRLPLPELMRELIPDESSVYQMFRLVGIRQDEEQN